MHVEELFDKYGFGDGEDKETSFKAIIALVDADIIDWNHVVDSCSHNIYIARRSTERLYCSF
jgi:hypothetical protein